MTITTTITRRGALNLGFSAVGVAVASCAGPAAAKPEGQAPTATSSRPSLLPKPVEKALVPLPFDATQFSGLSAELLTKHHDRNYAGAVKKLRFIQSKLETAHVRDAGSYWSEYGTLKDGEAAARNSALLHELYFANLIGGASPLPARLRSAIVSRFGSLDRMQELVRGCAKATSGWVIVAVDRSSNTIEVIPTKGHSGGAWHAHALLVLDVFEHSYALDYGPDKGAYLDAFFKNIHWQEVGKRLDAALASG